jgi:hypothetical protein
MSSQAWNLAFSSMSAVGVMLVRNPVCTVFGEAISVCTLNCEFITECPPSQGQSNNALSYPDGSITFDLHQLGDVVSDFLLETDIPAMPVMTGDTGVLYGVNATGIAMINTIQTVLGKLQYDIQQSELMYILHELSYNTSNRPVEDVADYRDPAILQQLSLSPQHFRVRYHSWWSHQQDTGTLADSLKICVMGGNACEVVVNFAPYSQWLVYSPNDDWTNSALLTHVRGLMAASRVRAFCRFHWMEQKEREYYQDNGMLNVYSYWQGCDTKPIIVGSTGLSGQKLVFNFPVNCVFWTVRNDTIALTDGKTYPGKVGVKDKFFFGTATGVEPITSIDLSLNSNSLISYANYHVSLLRTTMQRRGFDGCRTTSPSYCLVTQDKVLQRKTKAFIDFSRFDNITTSVTTSDANVSLFIWAHARNIMTLDYGTVQRPYAS